MDASANPFDRKLLFDHPDPYPLFRMLRQSPPVFDSTSWWDRALVAC